MNGAENNRRLYNRSRLPSQVFCHVGRKDPEDTEIQTTNTLIKRCSFSLLIKAGYIEKHRKAAKKKKKKVRINGNQVGKI